MNITEKLNSVFPTNIDKSKPIYSALISNEKKTGVLEKALTELCNYMQQWKSSKNIYTQTDVMFEKSSNLFTYLERFKEESEEAYKKRIKALFIRGNNTIWGTPYNVITTFKEYFGIDTVFLIENVDDKDSNIIKNFDFDEKIANSWTLNGATYSFEARFSKANGILFTDNNNNGYIEQQINEIMTNSYYHLHFFHKGNIKVQIKNNENKYWNGSDWQNTTTSILIENNEWNNSQVEFFTTNGTTSISLRFIGFNNTYLDYIELYKYVGYPTFRVIIQDESEAGKNALALAPNALPETNPENYDEKEAGYYNQAFLTGISIGFAQDIYDDLLNYLKTVGVKAYLTIVNKDVSNQ